MEDIFKRRTLKVDPTCLTGTSSLPFWFLISWPRRVSSHPPRFVGSNGAYDYTDPDDLLPKLARSMSDPSSLFSARFRCSYNADRDFHCWLVSSLILCGPSGYNYHLSEQIYVLHCGVFGEFIPKARHPHQTPRIVYLYHLSWPKRLCPSRVRTFHQ